MTAIWIAPYRLVPRSALNSRSDSRPRNGALLRISDGFGDLFPWPELGDAPLDEQLTLLARGELTPLTTRSLAFAALDGSARSQGRSLFEGLSIPESHWPGIDPPSGFDTIKVKGSRDFDPAILPPGVRIRIDFNGSLLPDDLLTMRLPVERIDFVEDPVPYSGSLWNELRQRTSLRLALDRGTATEGVDVLIHKPALQVWDTPLLPVVVTSYMDHPIGQYCAAWIAAAHGDQIDTRAGLFTHVLYEPNAFSDRIRSVGAQLLPPEGSGIGFDDLLELQDWERLR